ncbi:hypothetical protein [Duganella sp. BuS-21]|uniref:hypothetical protein n=1 Tax=Duganella sp. BuS-21 TaxID=2943848 RepID=UPI0035A5F325
MSKTAPNWAIWKRVRDVNAKEAVALTLNIEPRTPGTVRTQEYSDRLFLIERVLGANIHITLADLAKWSHSMEWNIPLELGAMASVTAIIYPSPPQDKAFDILGSIIAPGRDLAELQSALESEGCKLVTTEDGLAIHVQDGTVAGSMRDIKDIYSVASDAYSRSKNPKIGQLMRASQNSGGGASQSNVRLAHGYVSSLAVEAGRVLVKLNESEKPKPRVELSWQDEARKEANAAYLEAKKLGYELGKEEISRKVEERLAARQIESTRGRLTAPNILREALAPTKWKKPSSSTGKVGEIGEAEK